MRGVLQPVTLSQSVQGVWGSTETGQKLERWELLWWSSSLWEWMPRVTIELLSQEESTKLPQNLERQVHEHYLLSESQVRECLQALLSRKFLNPDRFTYSPGMSASFPVSSIKLTSFSLTPIQKNSQSQHNQTGEMNLMVKYLLHKSEYLILFPSTHTWKPNVVATTCNPSPGLSEKGVCSLQIRQSSQIGKF